MKINEVKKISIFAYDVLEKLSCKVCGEVPKFNSVMQSDGMGVLTNMYYTDNPGWLFKVNDNDSSLLECYCPTCNRRLKLKKLKEKTDGRSIQI